MFLQLLLNSIINHEAVESKQKASLFCYIYMQIVKQIITGTILPLFCYMYIARCL